jgi:hypothetical protein
MEKLHLKFGHHEDEDPQDLQYKHSSDSQTHCASVHDPYLRQSQPSELMSMTTHQRLFWLNLNIIATLIN